MKTKTFDKKLVLNKKTIAHLGRGELHAVNGGGPTDPNTGFLTCFSCETCAGMPTCVKTCPITGYPCIACAYPID